MVDEFCVDSFNARNGCVINCQTLCIPALLRWNPSDISCSDKKLIRAGHKSDFAKVKADQAGLYLIMSRAGFSTCRALNFRALIIARRDTLCSLSHCRDSTLDILIAFPAGRQYTLKRA